MMSLWWAGSFPALDLRNRCTQVGMTGVPTNFSAQDEDDVVLSMNFAMFHKEAAFTITNRGSFMSHILAVQIQAILAYIDPGTGSMLLQLLLGGVAGAWVILKLFGHRILAFFGRKPRIDTKEQ